MRASCIRDRKGRRETEVGVQTEARLEERAHSQGTTRIPATPGSWQSRGWFLAQSFWKELALTASWF